MRVVILLLAILALSSFVGCQAKPMVVSESGSESEGIKVHGDWTVEVTNPDGSLAEKRQFANAFVGQHLIAGLLSFDIEKADRALRFSLAVSPDGAWSDDVKCKDWFQSPDVQGLETDTLVLANTVHANLNDSVWNASCTAEISENEPVFLRMVSAQFIPTPTIMKGSAHDTRLSSRELDEPIPVWNGQVIAATVILSVE